MACSASHRADRLEDGTGRVAGLPVIIMDVILIDATILPTILLACCVEWRTGLCQSRRHDDDPVSR
ncbi:MAG: hypothetical protein ACON4I_05200 [Candidatus Puniceispirillaceae bacterium]